MALALRDSACGKITSWSAQLPHCSDLVLLHPTRYKIIPLRSQKPTLPFSFDTSIPLISCQQGQNICFQGLVKNTLQNKVETKILTEERQSNFTKALERVEEYPLNQDPEVATKETPIPKCSASPAARQDPISACPAFLTTFPFLSCSLLPSPQVSLLHLNLTKEFSVEL